MKSPACFSLPPRWAAGLVVGLGLSFAMAGATTADYAAVLASPLRSDEDRRADATRQPLALLEFARVTPGMRVLDVSAGGGYTTQLLALAVGPSGRVWAQVVQSRPALDRRLAEHPQANIELLLRPFDDPYPQGAPQLDLVTLLLSYHDIAYAPVDRAKMNRRLFEALAPGGHLIVIDHAARPGRGLDDTKTLHRIDEATLRAEVERAGFVLEQQGSFLRNAKDPREAAFFDMKMPTDRFALRFVKPRSR